MKRRTTATAYHATAMERTAWWTLLATVAALPLAMAIARNPGGSIALLADPYQAPKLLVLGIGLIVATCAWAWCVIVETYPVRTSRAVAAAGALSLIVLCSTLFALQPTSSLMGLSGLSTGAVTWLMSLWCGLLVAQLLAAPGRLRQLSWALVGGSTLVALIALMQSFGADPLATPFNEMTLWTIHQGLSTLGNPNYTGLYLTAPAVVAGGLILTEKGRWQRVLAIVATLAILGAVFITLTRAAWIGAAVGSFMLAVLIARDRATRVRMIGYAAAVLALVAVVGTMIAGPSAIVDRFDSLSDGIDAFSSGRVTLWKESAAAIGNRPLFGTGADHLSSGVYEVQSNIVIEEDSRFVVQDPHNLPLLIAGQFGIPALLAFIAYAALALASGRMTEGADVPASSQRTLYTSWIAGCIGYLSTSLISVYTTATVFLLFVLLGVVAAPGMTPATERRWLRWVAVMLPIPIVVTGLVAGIQNARASREVFLAGMPGQDSRVRYETAISITPWDTRTRLTYMWGKIGSMRAILGGPDAATASSAAESLDAEILQQILRTPDELLWYRMRIDLWRSLEGSPAYDASRVEDAIDFALEAFPDDVEFSRWREELDTP